MSVTNRSEPTTFRIKGLSGVVAMPDVQKNCLEIRRLLDNDTNKKHIVLTIEREENNPYDPYAVRVLWVHEGEHKFVGYIPKHRCTNCAMNLRSKAQTVVFCPSCHKKTDQISAHRYTFSEYVSQKLEAGLVPTCVLVNVPGHRDMEDSPLKHVNLVIDLHLK